MPIILLIVALIYCGLPWYYELAIWIVNLIIPDSIPYIDEILMFVPIVSKIKKIILLADFFEKYWKIIVGVLIIIVILIIVLLVS